MLEGFPIHLLLPPRSAGGITLLLYDEKIGELQLQAVSNGARDLVIILPSSLEDQSPEILFSRPEYRNATLIYAEIEKLPFDPGTIDEIIICLSNSSTTEFAKSYEVLPKLLKNDGVLSIVDAHSFVPPPSSAGMQATNYYVRSPNKNEYFVTGRSAHSMSNWPFHSLPFGVVATLKLSFNLFCDRYCSFAVARPIKIIILAPVNDGPLISIWVDQDEKKSLNKSSVGLFVKAEWNAILFGLSNLQLIVKFPLNDAMVERMSDNAKTICSLNEKLSSQLQEKIPAIRNKGEICGQYYWEESLCSGLPASALRFSQKWKQRTADSGFKFLLKLHQETRIQSLIDTACFDALFPQEDIDELCLFAKEYDSSFDLTELLIVIKQVICNQDLPLVQTHGDFWPGNILVNVNAELEAILDWDASYECSWPVIDLLHLLTYQNKHTGYWHFGSVITKRLVPIKLKSWERRLVTKYFSELNISDNLWVCFVAIYWLERCIQWAKTSSSERWDGEKWVRQNVINTAPIILAQMKSHYRV